MPTIHLKACHVHYGGCTSLSEISKRYPSTIVGNRDVVPTGSSQPEIRKVNVFTLLTPTRD